MAGRPRRTRYIVGMMTGTSLDGLDAALIMVTGRGLRMQATLLHHISRPLGGINSSLRSTADQRPMTAERLATFALDLGKLHLDALEKLLENRKPEEQPSLIAAHGQTVFHKPPVSWQLINPTPLAHAADCPVVFDLRQADLAAGGEGAPITPLADWILFRDPKKVRGIVNLGGFCNATVLPAGKAAKREQIEKRVRDIQGFDICACNHLLDGIARDALGKPYDKGGRIARSGTINEHAATLLMNILSEQHSAHRSLGTRDAALAWIDEEAGRLEPADLAATAAVTLGRFIGNALHKIASDDALDEIIIAGGGAKHAVLRDAISMHSQLPMRLSDEFGMPVQAREAAAMAVLGALCADGEPITLPRITGCDDPAPVAGSWIFPHGHKMRMS